MAFDKGIKLSAGFDLQSPFPLDSRNKVATLSDLNSLTSNDVESGHITFCEEDKKFYAYIDNTWVVLPDSVTITEIKTEIGTKYVAAIPEAYISCDSSDSEALEIVDDSTTPTSTQITVTNANAFGGSFIVGDYVKHRLAVDGVSATGIYKYIDDKIIESQSGMSPMTQTEFNNFFDNLTITSTITSSNYTP